MSDLLAFLDADVIQRWQEPLLLSGTRLRSWRDRCSDDEPRFDEIDLLLIGHPAGTRGVIPNHYFHHIRRRPDWEGA